MDWIKVWLDQIRFDHGLAGVVMALRLSSDTNSDAEMSILLCHKCEEDREFMLDLVEVMLEMFGRDTDLRGLEYLLWGANSLYRVRSDGAGLESQVAPGVRETVEEAAASASGSAGDHLTTAWNLAYRRKPDPVKSYSESIKGAEAALAASVSPQNSTQTLGTMIRDVAAKPNKWEFELDGGRGVETVLGMMRTLWSGQTSRHGGTAPTRAETLNEARVAVHLAAALVQIGNSSAFRLL